MRISLLIILLFGACVDKKTSYQTNSESISLETSLPQSTISTNPIYLDKTNSNYILSYGLTPELYLLENTGDIQHYGYKIEFISLEQSESISDGTISNNTYYIVADEGLVYNAIYYEPKNTQFYSVVDLQEVSNIKPLFSNINTNIEEPFFFELYQENHLTNITYIADISSNQRLYYKPDNNTYFVKTLELIKDSQYEYTVISEGKVVFQTNIIQNLTLYPISGNRPCAGIEYSNTAGLVFSRDDRTFEPYILEFQEPISE
ncbi:MAG: hypothetical protein ACRCVW_03170 [Brevinema sp.]